MGPRNQLTRQPVKGRKKGGGIRFGEMERDSLLAHGVSFLLHDRLMNCSDIHKCFICISCGSVLTPTNHVDPISGEYSVYCVWCQKEEKFPGTNNAPATAKTSTSSTLKPILLPFVTRYLAIELAAMGIRTTWDVSAYQ